jgi:hypothetical protein
VAAEGKSQGVESSWEAIVISILASPPDKIVRMLFTNQTNWEDVHGASEQYIWKEIPSFKAKGWK